MSDDEYTDRLPHICLGCGVHYPFIWHRCPRCGSTLYRDQETGTVHDAAVQAAGEPATPSP